MTERLNPLTTSYSLLGTVLALIIGVFFTGLGIAMLTNIVIVPNSEGNMSKLFGALLVVYGIFRLIRVYLKFKSQQVKRDDA